MSFNIYIDKKTNSTEKLKWVFETLAQYALVDFIFVETKQESEITIGFFKEDKIQTSLDFWKDIEQRRFDEVAIENNLFYLNEDGSKDYLATAFYFLNCLWEYRSDAKVDRFGRHEYRFSIWAKNNFKQPENIVNECFNELLKQLNIKVPSSKSFIHLSHDIDSIYGSFLQDGLSLLKKKRFRFLIPFMFRNVFSAPDWFNFKRIAEIEKKRNYKSSFFWLVNEGKTNYGVKNADYKINNSKVTSEINSLQKDGFENGLHKSISEESHRQEVEKLPTNKCISNRNHFLKFNFKDLIKSIEESNIKVDYSLGYAENIGYRNGYSLPFVPYNLAKDRPCQFIEVPLTIMDGTFSSYMSLEAKDAFNLVSKFVESNKHNSVISILWHNSHFTDYKYEGYPELYEKVLDFCNENKLESLNSKEILNKYSLQ